MFCVVPEVQNKFCVGRSNFGSDVAVCCSESRDRSSITSLNGGKVGNGVHRFLLLKVIRQLVFMLVKVISRLEPGASCNDLQITSFLVSGSKEGFKGHPCFAIGWQALPGFSVVKEEDIMEE